MPTTFAGLQGLESPDESLFRDSMAARRAGHFIGYLLKEPETHLQRNVLDFAERNVHPDIPTVALDEEDLLFVQQLGGAVLQVPNADASHV
jgi:hypothetical protein